MLDKKIKNAIDLEELLLKKYNDRLDLNSFSSLMGCVEGTFDSKVFKISFDGDKYMVISVSKGANEVLDELLPLLTEVMENIEPICSYDLQGSGMCKDEAMPTIEWDVISPEKRIKEIVNGRAFSSDAKIYNLKLNSDKSISDYLESEEEIEERIKNSKIYGIYPGSIKDTNVVNNLSEVDTFLTISALSSFISRCYHDLHTGMISDVDLTEEQYALEYLMYQTRRFGVELKEPQIGKHVVATTSYKAWYLFYSNHFNNNLTIDQWNEFQKAQKNGEDTTKYMPNGNWTDLLIEPKQKVLK